VFFPNFGNVQPEVENGEQAEVVYLGQYLEKLPRYSFKFRVNSCYLKKNLFQQPRSKVIANSEPPGSSSH
jgi:hypothetical protein